MKKILFFLFLALSFTACTQDEIVIEKESPTTRSSQDYEFTNVETYEGHMVREISGDLTCNGECEVTFRLGLNYPSGSRYSCNLWLGNSYFSQGQSAVKDYTVTLPAGVSKITMRLSQGTSNSVGGYARLIIVNVKGGSIQSSGTGYADLTTSL